jgi:enolase
MAKIIKIEAREILSSGGTPTIEATVTTESGTTGTVSVAWGASAGKYEAVTLFDGDPERYEGKGMLKAVANINGIIAAKLTGTEVREQEKIDKMMIDLDGTENKSRLGGNAILAVSLAAARAGAEEEKMPLWKYLGKVYGLPEEKMKLPKPMAVMIEGGKHADNSTDLQEYLITTLKMDGMKKAMETEEEIYEHLKIILEREKLGVNVGNEGAFAPAGIAGNEKPLEYLAEAITAAGFKPGVEAGISVDAAASEFWEPESGKYNLRLEQKKLTGTELIEYFSQWIGKYPLVSWEDMLSEDDWENWMILQNKIKGKILLIGDDLTATNTGRLKKAIDLGAIGGVIIKLNQAGTLTETVGCCKTATEAGIVLIPSHRGGGETNDTFLADLAVAVGAEYIKVGITRGERVEKYNRLFRIEEEIKTNG